MPRKKKQSIDEVSSIAIGNDGVKGTNTEPTLVNKVANRRAKRNNQSDTSEQSFVLAVANEQYSNNTPMRRNVAADIIRTDRYANIDAGLVPFRYSSTIYGNKRAMIDVRDAVILCQKCYYNFAIFRNIIDLMTEFSIGDLYFKGGSSKSKDFFNALFKKINMWDFQDKFFREYYRSGNVFIYRFDASLEQEDINRISQVFASQDENLNNRNAYQNDGDKNKNNNGEIQNLNNIEAMQVPSKYVILNPADIHMVGTANFGFGVYYKLLTAFELARLKNPQTEEDKLMFETFSPEIQQQILSGIQSVLVPLDIKKVLMVFYKKQDYEPFSIPMGYPVLEDINFKAELKKIDMAINRTAAQIVLLVTTGAAPDKGGINPNNIKMLRQVLANPSVNHTIVADYTTEAEFVIPDIGELLDPKKYTIVDQDINTGLNNVFAGDEKFANQAQKVKIFMSRLDQAKQTFLQNFLIPEIKRIAQSVGFKNFPTPYFKPGSLEDDINRSKIYARLIEVGVLTPEQGLEAIQTNTLPDAGEMVQQQEAYKEQRDKGLYLPLIGGSTMAPDGMNPLTDGPVSKGPSGLGVSKGNPNNSGRPTGTGTPKTKNTVSPIGTKASEEKPINKFSLKKMTNNLLLAQDLESHVANCLREIHDIKRLNKTQKSLVKDIANIVIANEEPTQWMSTAKGYCITPLDKNKDRISKIQELAISHQLDEYTSAIMFNSYKDEETTDGA